jgi:hypothetical protein
MQIKPGFFAKDGLDSNPRLREGHTIKERQPIGVANRVDIWLGRLHLFVYGDEPSAAIPIDSRDNSSTFGLRPVAIRVSPGDTIVPSLSFKTGRSVQVSGRG